MPRITFAFFVRSFIFLSYFQFITCFDSLIVNELVRRFTLKKSWKTTRRHFVFLLFDFVIL